MDVAAVIVMLLGALRVVRGLWLDIDGEMNINFADQNQVEFFLAHGASVLRDGQNPLFTVKMNFPFGVNTMANTSVLGVTIPLAPLTLLAGPHATFVVMLTLMFALTGVSWYFMLSRTFVTSRLAALIGAGFCAFSPGMVSHGNAHPNIVGQFLIPIIIWRVLTLGREGGRSHNSTLVTAQPSNVFGTWQTWREGVILALLVSWQVFINEEVLFFTALALGIFVAASAALIPEARVRAKRFTASLAVALVVAGALLVYPLWWQFMGPQSYHGLGAHIPTFGADLASFITYSSGSLGHLLLPSQLGTPAPAPNYSEENAYFGLPLMLLALGLIWWLRRNRAVIALAIVGGFFLVISLGAQVKLWGEPLVDGVWATLARLPILNSVVPGRFALVVAVVVGILLALGADRVASLWTANPRRGRWVPAAVAVAYALALLPIAPTPLETISRGPRAPAILASGELSRYVADDRAIMFVPPPSVKMPEPMGWLGDAGLAYHSTHGYFLTPAKDGHGISTPSARFLREWLYRIRRSGVVPPITPQDKAQAIRDLRLWRVDVLVLGRVKRADELRRAVTMLIGVEPQLVGGAWVWDVRALTAS